MQAVLNTLYLIFAFLCAGFCGFRAYAQRRTVWWWVILGWCFTVISVVWLLLLRPKYPRELGAYGKEGTVRTTGESEMFEPSAFWVLELFPDVRLVRNTRSGQPSESISGSLLIAANQSAGYWGPMMIFDAAPGQMIQTNLLPGSPKIDLKYTQTHGGSALLVPDDKSFKGVRLVWNELATAERYMAAWSSMAEKGGWSAPAGFTPEALPTIYAKPWRVIVSK